MERRRPTWTYSAKLSSYRVRLPLMPASVVLVTRVPTEVVWRLKLRQHGHFVLPLMPSGVIALAQNGSALKERINGHSSLVPRRKESLVSPGWPLFPVSCARMARSWPLMRVDPYQQTLRVIKCCHERCKEHAHASLTVRQGQLRPASYMCDYVHCSDYHLLQR